MADPDARRNEALLAELELHKAEFAALRDEILHSIDAERQSLNLTLITMGAGLGLIPFISAQNLFIILLLLPLVFHIILWDMLNTDRGISYLSNYLTGKLIPRVNIILDELGGNRHGTVAFGWETYISTLPVGKLDVLLSSLTPTRYWMPILAIAALIIAYGIIVNSTHYSPSGSEVGLLIANLMLLIYAGIQNAVIARRAMMQARSLKSASDAQLASVNVSQDSVAHDKKRKK